MMFSLFSITCIYAIIVQSNGNPILNHNNLTDVENSTSYSENISCERNVSLLGNQTLFEILNTERFWFVLARTKFMYGEQTWKNVIMKTITTNETIYLEFIGENSNGTCVSSEKGQILLDAESKRVYIHWANELGFLEMIFLDQNLTLFTLCYSLDLNKTDVCLPNQSEQFVIQNDHFEYKDDILLWLKSYCSSINTDDFVLNDDTKKCLSHATEPGITEVHTTEQSTENKTETIIDTKYSETSEQENITVTAVPEFEFTTRTNRTNRLETLEEYYSNSTIENNVEETTVMEIKEIVILSTNEDLNKTNVTTVEKIVLEPVTNTTVVEKIPLIVLHKALVNETATEILLDTSETIPVSISHPAENSNSTEIHIDTTTPFDTSSVSVTTMTEKQATNTSTTSSTNENSTFFVDTEHITSATTTTKVETTMELITPEATTSVDVETSTFPVNTEGETTSSATTTVETTTELTTTTTSVPADCPILKDCPFDYCAFARKVDNRGCPTCNCLHSNKSNIICPSLTCQACLYGHYTDPNGCPICQCQSRPYPPLGERCPHLNCEPCYFGTVKDEYNCDTCICIRPNNQECPVLNCTFGPCKYGSKKDEDSCPTCDCLLPIDNTTQVNCSTSLSCPLCHLGYVTDADGCETCQCKLRGNAPCVSVTSECQCEYGSYLNADGCETCSCLPDPKNATRQACWELSNQANFHNISGPVCAADGSFSGRQCDKVTSKCWCVTPTGIPIVGFESRPEENVNCACAVELYQVSSLRMIGHHLLCLLNGNYAPIQCDGRYCSCVDENGIPIGPSVSIQNRDQLRCVGVYQQLHPERFVLHRATIEVDGSRLPYGMYSSLCLTHLEQVRNSNITDDHILVPVCDANGLYAPVQCDQSERYCWCVDKKTGVEMEGTRRLNARPNCNMV